MEHKYNDVEIKCLNSQKLHLLRNGQNGNVLMVELFWSFMSPFGISSTDRFRTVWDRLRLSGTIKTHQDRSGLFETVLDRSGLFSTI